ncbi:BTAD domain-containing putative transcriptional regulator [Streptomyces sp. NPDC050485]|uniref:AfsR/SARP family transcriptional regulator n=1 Tax=Streptomyces sp. NPDC050485 TaxID=3365617 RepID=UPI0037BE08D7
MTVLDLRSPTMAGACAETEFRLLGPVGIHDGRTGAAIAPSGSKQRALFSALVIHAGELLSADRLIEELWGNRPPTNAPNALQAHVARLRRLLPAGDAPGEPGHEWISTLPTGYLLTLGRATTDVQHFERLSAQSRATAPSDPARALELLRHALSLWHGPALQDSRYGPICAAEAARLEEKRLTTLEALYETSLRCGQHGEISGELEKLTADHPLRERFYDLLMVALYRSGRQAEALGVYERARRCLASALGIGPGPALRGRMEAILHQSPSLSAPRSRPAPAQPATVAHALDLGREVARLQERIDELNREQAELVRRFDAMTALLPHPS